MNLWTVKTIAAQFGVTVKTVRDKWVKRPDLPAPKVAVSQKTKAWEQQAVIRWAEGRR